MIHSQQIRFSYDGNTDALQFPDIYCPANEELLIAGKSGSGKTTLLSILGGLLKPTSGKVQIGGTDITNLSSKKMDQFRGRNIGFVLQQHYFVEALTVEENLKLAQRLAGNSIDRKSIAIVLEELSIDHKMKEKPSRLSVGERQRLGIARAIINKPVLLLADEPTSALDDENCNAVIQLLRKEVRHSGAALIVVSHDDRLKEHFSNSVHL